MEMTNTALLQQSITPTLQSSEFLIEPGTSRLFQSIDLLEWSPILHQVIPQMGQLYQKPGERLYLY